MSFDHLSVDRPANARSRAWQHLLVSSALLLTACGSGTSENSTTQAAPSAPSAAETATTETAAVAPEAVTDVATPAMPDAPAVQATPKPAGFDIPPLVTDNFTADPSAHVFEGRIYVYPSHDVDTGIPDDDLGSQYDMRDYHVYSMDRVGAPVIDHGVALKLEDIPWTSKQLWAPDAATSGGQYFLYFPAKDKDGIFRIGVAVSDRPEGPFTAEPEPIPGSYSMDPAVFVDDDGQAYMYFGGIWGGQLQNWKDGQYDPTLIDPRGDDEPALLPRVAKMSGDMKSFDGPVMEVQILDENGELLRASDNERRFFEAAWMHKYNGKYYLSYSTGDTHYLVYAIGDNPLGPFTYAGRILEPVLGWTSHHSIVEHEGKWYLFFHDASLSGGQNNLRSVKVMEIEFDADGRIQLVNQTD